MFLNLGCWQAMVYTTCGKFGIISKITKCKISFTLNNFKDHI